MTSPPTSAQACMPMVLDPSSRSGTTTPTAPHLLQDLMNAMAQVDWASVERFLSEHKQLDLNQWHRWNLALKDDRTPLMMAASKNIAEDKEDDMAKIVQRLLEHKAKPELCSKPMDRTALMLAVSGSRFRLLWNALGDKTKINDRDKQGRTALHALATYDHGPDACAWIRDACDPNVQDNKGNTALMLGVAAGHLEFVSALLESKNVNVRLLNAEGREARWMPVDFEQDEIRVEACRELVRAYAMRMDVTVKDAKPTSPVSGLMDVSAESAVALSVVQTQTMDQILKRQMTERLGR